jgi:hypothetical protein
MRVPASSDIKKRAAVVRECLNASKYLFAIITILLTRFLAISFIVSVPVQNRHLQVETLSQFLTCLASKVLKLTSYIVHGYSLCRKIGCAEDLIAPTGIGMDDLANME